ncbi:glycerate kinase [Naumannella cuiyingiana]|uniref:Glycerate kinase n=1 Tax=Naumannella cuiyingiana TaxID=1347891 RepID=A0A7Z0DB11_9ACTN|nr:glycerate kinase [Naumannella cuiyingiana]NYI72024.1 glycerate kinase [Naumannella cuiyingiana]
MRVLVASDRIGSLSSADAGQAIALGWRETAPDAQLAVVPIGEAGEGLDQAVADLLGAEVTLLPGDPDGSAVASCVRAGGVLLVAVADATADPGGWDPSASSLAVGRALADALDADRTPPDRIVLDLSRSAAHDGGAGILAGLGATADRPLDHGAAGLSGIGHLDLGPVRERLGATVVDLAVPADETGRHLLGLRGITSLRGRDADVDAATMLATDAALESFAAALTRAGGDEAAAAAPGAGAGGVAYGLAALGARVRTGGDLVAELARLPQTLRAADLIVTGCTTFDFARRGGGVIAAVADWGAESMTPVVLLAGTVLIGAREMRTLGIEAAHAVHPSPLAAQPDVTPGQLTALSARIARSWAH